MCAYGQSIQLSVLSGLHRRSRFTAFTVPLNTPYFLIARIA